MANCMACNGEMEFSMTFTCPKCIRRSTEPRKPDLCQRCGKEISLQHDAWCGVKMIRFGEPTTQEDST